MTGLIIKRLWLRLTTRRSQWSTPRFAGLPRGGQGRDGQVLTALSKCLISASYSSSPRRHLRRPSPLAGGWFASSYAFLRTSSEGRLMFCSPIGIVRTCGSRTVTVNGGVLCGSAMLTECQGCSSGDDRRGDQAVTVILPNLQN